MITEKLQQLIKLLTEKTNEKKAIWNKASGDSQFKLSLPNGISLTIGQWTDNWREVYEVVIFNSDGAPIQKYVTDSDTTSEDLSLMKDFHSSASSQYYRVDETMDALFNSVTSQEVIGNIESPKEPIEGGDDDLPF